MVMIGSFAASRGRDAIELVARVTEHDVPIGYDRARSRLVFRGNDDGVDPVGCEYARNGAQRRVGTAGDDTRVHHLADCLLCVRRRGHEAILGVR